MNSENENNNKKVRTNGLNDPVDTGHSFSSAKFPLQDIKKQENPLRKDEQLFQACLRGNLAEVEYWLQQGANANAKISSEISQSIKNPRPHPVVTPLMGIAKSRGEFSNKIAIADRLIVSGADVNYISELNVASRSPFQGADTVLDVCGKDSPLGKHLIRNYSAKTSLEIRRVLSPSELSWQPEYKAAREEYEKNLESGVQPELTSKYFHNLPWKEESAEKDSKVPRPLSTHIISIIDQNSTLIASKCRNILDLPVEMTAEVLRKTHALEEIKQCKDDSALVADICKDMERFRPAVKEIVAARMSKLYSDSVSQGFFQSKSPSKNKRPKTLSLDRSSEVEASSQIKIETSSRVSSYN